jgi:hypothetical protein
MSWRRMPKAGERVARTGFLWMPKTIGLETKWLERATWIDQATLDGGWMSVCWGVDTLLDLPKYLQDSLDRESKDPHA